jgi:aryl-alcohol dehydrogenase-like predicted oxidoreductase
MCLLGEGRESEQILSRSLKTIGVKRSGVIIATKVGVNDLDRPTLNLKDR